MRTTRQEFDVMHNIDTYHGQVTMAYQGEAPWHQLGEPLPASANVAQALATAHLDWTVRLDPIFRLAPDQPTDSPAYQLITDKRAVVRDDGRYLATVGDQYVPVQNADAFSVLAPACADYGVEIVTAGAIDGGKRVWMLARLPESIEVTDGDRVNGYFLVTTGHDGYTAFTGRPTPIRVVCQNTLNAAMSARGVDIVRIRHTATAEARVKEAAHLVTAMTQSLRETGETFRQLAEHRMTPQEIAEYIKALLPDDERGNASDTTKQRRRDIGALVWAGIGADLAGADANGATAWACYNAVTEYFDHVRPAQSKSPAGQARANVSAIFGANHAAKAKALTLARQLVAV
jgi:phage/plasmid-like protein (TIGR03299 family)